MTIMVTIIVIHCILAGMFVVSKDCSPNQYSEEPFPICFTCPPGCSSCTSYTQCTSYMFPGIQQRIQNGGCVPDYETYNCEPCKVTNCKYCSSATEKTCDLCYPPFIFDKSALECVCKDKFYGDNCENLCSIPNCNKCKSQSQCLECRDYYEPSSDSTTCQLIEKCEVQFCQKCIKSRDICEKCYEPFQLSQNGQRCGCPKGQGVNGVSTCSPCPKNCDYCEYTYETNSCSKCSESYVLAFNLTSYSDACICPNGTAENQNWCVPCTQGCKKCLFVNSTELCLECHQTFLQVENYTKCRCPQYFGVSTLDKPEKCVKCSDQNCLECFDNYNNCTLCKQTMYQQNGICYCMKGMFVDDSQNCKPCAIPYCTSCTNQTICLQCLDTFVFNADSTVCACPLNTGIKLQEKIKRPQCQSCGIENCLKCNFENNSVQCYLCEENYEVSSDGTACSCSSQVSDDECQICQFPCQTCESSDPTKCLSCISNLSLNSASNTCQLLTDCEFPCQRCVNEETSNGTTTVCVLCYPPFIMGQKNTCICPEGTFEIWSPSTSQKQSYCQPCVEHCSSCLNGSSCEQCATPYYLSSGGCEICGAGEGYSLNSNECIKCTNKLCQSCMVMENGEQECFKCSEPTTLNQTTKSCACPSNQGFNSDQTYCQPCQVNFCQTCPHDSSTCEICQQGLYLQNNACVCRQGGPSKNGTCQHCQMSNCVNCSRSSTICEECSKNFRSNKTSCICQEGYAAYEEICAPCLVPNCLNCPTSTNKVCGKCKSPFQLNEQRNECICPPGQGSNLINGCGKCLVTNCRHCPVSFEYTCNQCEDQFVLNDQSNQCVCPYGQGFKENGCQTCKIQNCAHCHFWNDTTCNQCANNYILNDDFTQCNCLNQRKCPQCNIKNCHICQTQSQCTSCQTPFRLNNEKTQCICPIGQGFNQEGSCINCSVQNCEICSGSNLQSCDQCIWPFFRGLNGQCDCPPETNCYNCIIDNCLICSSLSTCDSCVEPYIVNSDGQCSCPIGFFQAEEGDCSPCEVENCASCNSSSVSTCNQCMNSFLLAYSSDNTVSCSCPQGQGINQSGQCSKCSVPFCKNCQNSYQVQCSACLQGFSRSDDQTECSCPLGKGISSDNKTCEPCKVQMCNICPNSTSNICVQCSNPFILSNNASQCSCSLGTYQDGNSCIKCSTQYCNKCDKLNNIQQCLECNDPYLLINQSCLCPDESVPDSEGTCGQCEIQHCLSCNLNENGCDYCENPFIFSNGTCQCPVRYFQNQGNCSKCDVVGCQRCNDASTCDQCLEPFILNSQKNLCSCPLGFFLNLTYQSCEPCSVYKCAFCQQSNTECKICFEPFVLSSDKKRCTCPPGKGPTNFDSCAECSVENCASCSEPFNTSSCSFCKENFQIRLINNSTSCICKSPFILSSNNVCSCPPGYGLSKTQACEPCITPNCQKCSYFNDTRCEKCFEGATMNLDSNKCECKKGYGPINGQGCHKCIVENCALCQNAIISQCLSCSKGFTKRVLEKEVQCVCLPPLILSSNNQCQCPLGFAWDYETSNCKSCQVSNCAQCNSTNFNKCQICLDPFTLSQGECICHPGSGYSIENGCSPCQVKNCKVCHPKDPNQCLTCFNSVLNLIPGEQQCPCTTQNCLSQSKQCQPGFVYDANNQNCSKCIAQGCMTCSSPSSNYCLKCFANSVLFENQCSCIKGFAFNQSGLCDHCEDINCEECNPQNLSICTSCQNGFIVDNITSKCICSSSSLTLNENNQCVCINGTLNNSGQCDACKIRNCQTCSGLNSLASCFSCFPPFITDQSKKFCRCPNGTYMTENSCEQCSSPYCQNCQKDGKSCVSCSQPFILNAEGECSCKTGYVLENSTCKKCHVSNCGKCLNSTTSICSECFPPAILSSNKTTCGCPIGYVISETSRGCMPCKVKNCASCSNSIENNCNQCLQNYLLNTRSSQCLCKSGYGPNLTGSCVPCSIEQCKVCKFSYLTCSICEEPYISNQDGTACICPLGFASNGQGGCAACQVHNCAQCINSGANSCEKCIPPYVISSNKMMCLLPGNIGQTCPIGHGINSKTNICEPCQVENCERCFKSSVKCSICFQPFISNSDGSQCVCPAGQGSNGEGGCAFCSVKNCETCENANSIFCNQCLSPYALTKDKQNCYLPINIGQNCPFGHGLSSNGICEPCTVKNCARCFSDSSYCTVCLQPFVLNSDGNECICPPGQILYQEKQYGGCLPCQVSNCAKCRSPTQNYCESCLPPFILHSDHRRCIWPFANIQQCPRGQGLNNGTQQCLQCQVKNCIRCDQGIQKCSICQFPFITSSDAKSCVCPPGFGDNLAGGCSLCQVEDCLACENSMSKFCHVCKPPFQPNIDRRRCIQKKSGKRDKHDKFEDDQQDQDLDIGSDIGQDIGSDVVDGLQDVGEDAVEDVAEDAVEDAAAAVLLAFLNSEETMSRGKIIALILGSTIILTSSILGCIYCYLKRKNLGNKQKWTDSQKTEEYSLKSPINLQLEMESFQN